jgi:hypothetical protein
MLASDSNDGTIRLWNSATGKSLGALKTVNWPASATGVPSIPKTGTFWHPSATTERTGHFCGT